MHLCPTGLSLATSVTYGPRHLSLDHPRLVKNGTATDRLGHSRTEDISGQAFLREHSQVLPLIPASCGDFDPWGYNTQICGPVPLEAQLQELCPRVPLLC